MAAVLVAPLLLAVPASAAGELEVVQLDVGQGDAALFRGPCGEVGLLDAGEGSAGAVTDQMRAWGARAVTWAATSHYDADHVGDVADLSVAVPVVYDRGGGAAEHSTATYSRYYIFASTRSHQACRRPRQR
jgi:beta-lactamase superfamily II metal-dependent hydrolase